MILSLLAASLSFCCLAVSDGTNIYNSNRTTTILGENVTYYEGPVDKLDSDLKYAQGNESLEVSTVAVPYYTSIVKSASNVTSNISSVEDFDLLYDSISNLAPIPMSTNFSDESYGRERTTIKGFNMYVFQNSTVDVLPILSDELSVLKSSCDYNGSLESLESENKIFVMDYSYMKHWSRTNDIYGRNLPSVIGYFCYNDKLKHLMPLSITMLDIGVEVSPVDDDDLWKLSKASLNACEVADQQIRHLSITHGISIPIRVEMERHLTSTHPLRRLLGPVFKFDYGLDYMSQALIFQNSTNLDLTFGLNATMATGYIVESQKNISFDIINPIVDYEIKGFRYVTNHQRLKYTSMYHESIFEFVRVFINQVYPCQSSLDNDDEVKSWFEGMENVNALSSIDKDVNSKANFVAFITNLLYHSSVYHHSMNGQVTWHGISLPYSVPGLWKTPIDIFNEDCYMGDNLTVPICNIDVMSYTANSKFINNILVMVSYYNRPVAHNETIRYLFDNDFVNSMNTLKQALEKFLLSIEVIGETIRVDEEHNVLKYNSLHPDVLPYSTWS